MRFRPICLSAWPECWPCLARPRRCEDANARIKDAKAGRRTILVLINYPSRPNLGSDLAHSILLDLKILRERTRKNLAGSPETRNART